MKTPTSTGFLATLDADQLKAALSYSGPESHGEIDGEALRYSVQETERMRKEFEALLIGAKNRARKSGVKLHPRIAKARLDRLSVKG